MHARHYSVGISVDVSDDYGRLRLGSGRGRRRTRCGDIILDCERVSKGNDAIARDSSRRTQ